MALYALDKTRVMFRQGTAMRFSSAGGAVQVELCSVGLAVRKLRLEGRFREEWEVRQGDWRLGCEWDEDIEESKEKGEDGSRLRSIPWTWREGKPRKV